MSDIIATEAENEKRLQARVGDTVLIRLPESPTTGYRWTALQGTPASDDFISGSDAIGAGGVRVLRFRVKSPGAVTLELVLARSWEKQAPAKRFKVELHVLE